MKLKGLAVLCVLVLGCSAAFAQTSYSFGFLSSSGVNEYCNYETFTVGGGGNFYLQGYDVLSLCPGFNGNNASIAGFGLTPPVAAFVPVAGKSYVYADQLYDAYYGAYTGEQWIGITKTAPTKLKFGNYSWAGYVGFFGYEFLGNYGFLTNTLPSAAKTPLLKSTISAKSVQDLKAAHQKK